MNDFENNNLPNNDDSFYSKKADDIIQDEPTTSPPQQSYQPSFSYQAPPSYSTGYNNYQPPKPKKEKNGHSVLTIIIACALSAVISAACGFAVSFAYLKNNNETTSNNATTIIKQESSQGDVNITVDETSSSIAEAVAKKCTNSVVGIRTTTSVSSFFGGSQEQTGDGSGVIYTTDGYIITNYHVIESAVESSRSKIDVFIGEDKTNSYSASVIGYNISCDLAVIKINVSGLTPIELGNSDELDIGQYVVTIGSPGGLEFLGSVTYGIISGLDRTVSTNAELKLIQTDAAINPGNSGGALLNAEGKLIGINSSKIASVDYEGMGFAIPINAVKEKCDKIISQEGDSKAYFGVSISSTYTSEVLSFYGYPSGAVVSTVAQGSPAYLAGIERGDIITEFNGIKITEYTVFTDALYDCKGGDKVKVKIYRDGKTYTVNVTLESETVN